MKPGSLQKEKRTCKKEPVNQQKRKTCKMEKRKWNYGNYKFWWNLYLVLVKFAIFCLNLNTITKVYIKFHSGGLWSKSNPL